jgi:hypothetical protein
MPHPLPVGPYRVLCSDIDKILILINISLTAFEKLNFNFSVVPDALKSAIEATSEVIKMIFNGHIIQLATDIATAKKYLLDTQDYSVIKEKFSLFESKTNEFRENLLGSISNTRFTIKYRWKTGLLNTNISACTCCKQMNHKKRMRFVSQLKESTHEQGIKNPFTICSFGSGNCYQELVIHTSFTTMGRQVNWVLIEPKLEDPSSTEYKATTEFKKIVKFMSHQTTILSLADNILTYMKKIESKEYCKPDIVLAIDLGQELGRYDVNNSRNIFLKEHEPQNPRLFVEICIGKIPSFTRI